MVPLLRFSLQSHPLLFHRTTSSATAALRMTPSPTSIRSLKPNFSIPMAKSTSEITSKSTNFPITKDSTNSLFNSRRLTQSECFSSAPGENPITVAESECVGESVECPLVVVSFYKFAVFPDHADLRMPLKELCERLRVSGGIILAPEGINGSICGICNSVDEVLAFIQSDDRLKGLRCIESPVSPEEEAIHHGHMSSSPLAAGEDAPFRWDHVRVKLKQEIVTLGMPSVSPMERVGEYVSPKEWNNLISDPDTVVIDVRNDYETRIGKFKQAVDPCTTAFREFPEWVEKRFKTNEPKNQIEPTASDNTMDEQINEMENNMPRVAMYCTGGIRCEKASSFLLGKGFKEVYHLQGGILKYLEEVPKAESLWEGECFVFDKRVSVEHGLTQGTYKLCYGCKQPVSDADMETPEWEYGVTCPYCYTSKSEEEKERARARQNQFERWGVIGGPDKGRKPTIIGVMEERLTEQMPGSAC